MNEARSIIRIRPKRTFDILSSSQILGHRGLLYHLVWRDLASMHITSGLGFIWLILQPLALTVMLTLFLYILGRSSHEPLPAALIVMSGLTIWNYFSLSVTRAAASIINNSHLLKKVYFPRILFPITQIFVSLIDFLAVLSVTLLACLYFGFTPTLFWLLLPVPLILLFFLALACGLWLSALNTYFRDVGHILPVILQLIMYGSPIIYTVGSVPVGFQKFYILNPIVGIVESFRWFLFQIGSFPTEAFAISLTWMGLLLISGLAIFRSLEENFADVV